MAGCVRLAKHAEDSQRAGKLDEAIRTVEAKMNIEHEACGENSDEVASSLEWLVRLDLQQGDFAGAHQKSEGLAGLISIRLFGHHWQAVDARIAAQRAERLGRLGELGERRAPPPTRGRPVLRKRARELQTRKEYIEAIKCATDALTIQREVLGEHDPETVSLIELCGILHLTSGDAGRAVPLLRQTLELSQQVIGEHYGDDLLRSRPEEDQIKARQRVGASHPDSLRRACQLAEAYLKQDKPDEARKILAQARMIRQAAALSEAGRVSVPLHDGPRVCLKSAGTSPDHAEIIRGLRDSAPAKDVVANEAMLALQRAAVGPDDDAVVETLAWLAAVYATREEFSAAEAQHGKRPSTRSGIRTMGPEHLADHSGTMGRGASPDEGEAPRGREEEPGRRPTLVGHGEPPRLRSFQLTD